MEEPFSFTAEGSCSEELIKIWAGQFPAALRTGEAEQPLSALGQGLGCHGRLVEQRCKTKSWAWCVCKALRSQSQAWGSPHRFRRPWGEKEEVPRLQQPALGKPWAKEEHLHIGLC